MSLCVSKCEKEKEGEKVKWALHFVYYYFHSLNKMLCFINTILLKSSLGKNIEMISRFRQSPKMGLKMWGANFSLQCDAFFSRRKICRKYDFPTLFLTHSLTAFLSNTIE